MTQPFLFYWCIGDGRREGEREGDGRKDMSSRNGKESKCIDLHLIFPCTTE